MKHSFLYILLFFIIIFRNLFINSINNIGYLMFNNKDNIMINILNNKINFLEEEYNNLLDFKNKIDITYDYSITNLYKNNYGYDRLLINGRYHRGDEVVNSEGLIGVISNSYNTYSEVDYIYYLNIPVIINSYQGKITGHDRDNNLIIKEIIGKVDINDKVYSINNNYIGKVIKVIDNTLDKEVVVKTISLDNINYVGVISK